jgi:hypothetical protein
MHPVGYKWLELEMALNAIPHFCESYISEKNRHLTVQRDGLTEEHYPKSKTVENSICGHLEFAVKNEGVNLGILKACFQKLDPAVLTEHVREKPTGKFGRILWFLYEELTGEMLDLPDLKQGNYVELLDSKKYFTGKPVQQSRQRVNMNLPGTLRFSPVIRKTKTILEYGEKHLDERCRQIISKYPPDLVARAVHQMYLGETRSTNAIENEVLSPDRERRFKALLEKAGTETFFNEGGMLDLHRQVIVDVRFQTDFYRETQEYVGTGSLYSDAEVHFVPPRPQELGQLLGDFYDCAQRIMESDVHPVVKAASLSFLFVYLHPFRDGNGRMHRFLIHHIISKTGFAPSGQIFPVSQVMRDDVREYQQVLNRFSSPLMERVRYTQDSIGHMTVLEDTSDYYRYIDLTVASEFLFKVIEKTLDRDLLQQLQFLSRYDRAHKGLTALFDGMPNREIDLLIKFCRQNSYQLSKAKREMNFPMLTDDEVINLQHLVKDAFEE